MAGFNKHPIKSSSTSSSSAASGFFPVFVADSTYRGPPTAVADLDGSHVGGFLNNGDYIALPISSADTIDYFNNAGTQVVTGAWAGGLALTEINAACDKWVGPMFDATASLIYLCGVDVTTTPDTYYFATINAAGTLTNIGNAQITTDFASTPDFNISSASAGAACLYRTADGSGNLFVRVVTASIIQQAEFNISTGALVADTSTIISGTFTCPYKTANGNFVGISQYTVANTSAAIYIGGNSIAMTQAGLNTGIGGSPSTSPYVLQWGGRVIIATGVSSVDYYGPRAYAVTEFDSKIDAFASALGV